MAAVLKNKTTHELLQLCKQMIPPLLPTFHKGQAGRIAVIGGCEDYTGAPYFSAMAATSVGADMSHIVCEKSAGQVIKTYSPNLMVHPYMYDSNTVPRGTTVDQIVDRVNSILNRVHVIIVGPGLGRDELMLELTEAIINEAKRREMPIVLDADGLWLIQKKVNLIKGYKHAILTPNVVEFQRLQQAVGLESDPEHPEQDCMNLCKALDGVVIIEKGQVDYISDGTVTIKGTIEGCKKRVSGQGDTLSGSIGTFMAWKLAYQQRLWDHDNSLSNSELMLLSAFAGSSITRHAGHIAYSLSGRGTLTSDLTTQVGRAFGELFGYNIS